MDALTYNIAAEPGAQQVAARPASQLMPSECRR